MSLHTLPCGCRIEKDDKSIAHIFPCKMGCPGPEALAQAFGSSKGVPVVDCRPAEAVIGRHLSQAEQDRVVEAILPPERN